MYPRHVAPRLCTECRAFSEKDPLVKRPADHTDKKVHHHLLTCAPRFRAQAIQQCEALSDQLCVFMMSCLHVILRTAQRLRWVTSCAVPQVRGTKDGGASARRPGRHPDPLGVCVSKACVPRPSISQFGTVYSFS